MDFLLLEGANIWDVYEKYYADKINQRVYDVLAHCDPTSKGDNKGKYLPWIIKSWLSEPNGKNEYLEGIAEHIRTILGWYDKHRTQLPQEQQDISKLSYEKLTDIYDFYKDKLFTQKEIRQQADIVFNNSQWEIVIPKTWAASKLYGSNTRWCTASNDDDYHFKNYSKQGPLYINIDKVNNKKWQFHPASDSYFDEEDNDLLEGDVMEYNDTIVNYANIPSEVVDWYERNEHDIYEKITEPSNGNWDDDALFSQYGSHIGYFRDGTLYDVYREEVGEYYDIHTIGSTRIVMNNRDSTIDVININDGDLEVAGKNLRDWEVNDYYGNDSDIVIGVEESGYFDVYPLFDSWDYNTSGIESIYKEITTGTWLLQWVNSPNTFDIVSLSNGDIMVASGIYVDDEHEPYIDDDDYDTIYFWQMRQGEIAKYKTSLSEGSDGDADDVVEEPEGDYEVDLVQTENFKRKFWEKLNKLNEIHKRNAPLQLD